MMALFGLIISNNVASILSAVTTKEIYGSAPYLTFDGGRSHADSVSPLLSIMLPDNKVINALEDESSMESPIMLDKKSVTFADIKTLVPFKNYPNILTDEVIDNNGYWQDDDGDKLNHTSTSKLTINWQNLEGQDITSYVKNNSNSVLNGCDAPYKLTLKLDDIEIVTQYGIPSKSGKFTGGKHTYYIYPKIDKPKFCYAKPNLEFDLHSSELPYDGAISSINAGNGEWNKHRGFYAYNPANPGANFPTTGSHNLFFYLSVAGMKAQEFINANGNTISKGGVTLKLNAENNSPTGLVKMTLIGPKENNPSAFQPSVFSLHGTHNEPLYSFKLERWYVAKKGGAGGYQNAVTFCNSFNGGGYRVIKVLDFSNSNRAGSVDWQNGIIDETYLRKISYKENGYWMGGLLSEWGRMTQIYYKDSDWEFFQVGDPEWKDATNRAYYWTSDQKYKGTNFVVEANNGLVGDRGHSDQDYRVACVTP
ncbi:hypothetical protein A9G30_07460 [Gilliamella sp. Fer4-1]|nr:hypothetical protein A9G30_07460 [Gilliamella apicola]